MLHTLRQPKWMVGTMVVLVLAALFVRLGIWQLDRLEQRRELNAIGQARLDSEPADLEGLLGGSGAALSSLEYRRAVATGVFDTSEEVLIRSQVALGQAGFHVITPLVVDDGSAVLVNRGWVPLEMDSVPVEASPATGTTRVEGWIHLSQIRPSFGPEDPAGDLDVFNRVDVARIGEQLSYEVAPIYLVAMGESGQDLPITVDEPDFSDEGPHLSYAIQWFGFALIGLVGWYFLIRRKTVSRRSHRG